MNLPMYSPHHHFRSARTLLSMWVCEAILSFPNSPQDRANPCVRKHWTRAPIRWREVKILERAETMSVGYPLRTPIRRRYTPNSGPCTECAWWNRHASACSPAPSITAPICVTRPEGAVFGRLVCGQIDVDALAGDRDQLWAEPKYDSNLALSGGSTRSIWCNSQATSRSPIRR